MSLAIALADQLADEGTIRMPATGWFHYLMVQQVADQSAPITFESP